MRSRPRSTRLGSFTWPEPLPDGTPIVRQARCRRSLPVVLLAVVPALQFRNWQWLALALPVAVWGAWPFHRAALVNARHGAATMDTLVSGGRECRVPLVACRAVLRQRRPARNADGLRLAGGGRRGGQHVPRCRVRGDGAHPHRPLLRSPRQAAFRCRAEGGAVAGRQGRGRAARRSRGPGARGATGRRGPVRGWPGEKIAADGVVESGSLAVDTSMLPGEPVPAEVTAGDAVTGGGVNAGGRLVVRATRVGAATQLAQMARLVTEAQAGKAPVQRLADRISAGFGPVVIAIALVTLIGGLAAGQPAEAAFTAAVAVLIIACPCAMGLATPTASLFALLGLRHLFSWPTSCSAGWRTCPSAAPSCSPSSG